MPALDDQPSINLDTLRSIGGGALVSQVVKIALDAIPKDTAQAVSALNEKDMQSVSQAAHKMGNSAANIGATELQNAWRKVERLADLGHIEALADSVARACTLNDKTLSELKAAVSLPI